MNRVQVATKSQAIAAISAAAGNGDEVEIIWTHANGQMTKYRFPSVPAHKVSARAKRLKRMTEKLAALP